MVYLTLFSNDTARKSYSLVRNSNVLNINEMTIDKFIRNLKKLVSDDDKEKAIITLSDFLKDSDAELRSNLILLSSQLKNIKNNKNLGIITNETYNTENSKITLSLIQLLNEIEDKYKDSEVDNRTFYKSSPLYQEFSRFIKKDLPYLVIIVVIIVLFVLYKNKRAHLPNIDFKEVNSTDYRAKKTFKNLDNWELIERLYNAEYDSGNKYGIWQPNTGEIYDCQLDDGKYFTKVEQIIKFGQDYSLVVFSSDKVESYASGCHGCAPITGLATFKATNLDDENNSSAWEILNFKKCFGKFGAWGQISDIEVIKIGNDKYAIRLDGGYSMSGGYEGYTSLYDTYFYNSIFHVDTYMSNKDALIEGDARIFEYTSEINILDKSNKDYYDIVVRRKGTEEDEKTGKVNKVDKSQTYTFSVSASQFIKQE